MQAGECVPEHRPSSRAQMFLAFTILSMQGFGGVMAIARRELVE